MEVIFWAVLVYYVVDVVYKMHRYFVGFSFCVTLNDT